MHFNKVTAISASLVGFNFLQLTLAARECVRTGCNGELCVDSKYFDGTASPGICQWKPEFECYKTAVCKQQADGTCGFTKTSALERCITDAKAADVSFTKRASDVVKPAPPKPAKQCVRSGCNKERCVDAHTASSEIHGICLWKPEFDCLKTAACELQSDGHCGFTQTPELNRCIADVKSQETPEAEPLAVAQDGPTPTKQCVKAGCNGELCVDAETASTINPGICIWQPEFECFKSAACEVQTNGDCGFTQTSELNRCIADVKAQTELELQQQQQEQEQQSNTCVRAGCNSEVCVDVSIAASIHTPCIWRPEFKCFVEAECEMQKNGQCGFTKTEEIERCVLGGNRRARRMNRF
ncbi:hypothetical protein HK102_001229 [Quaeritorhiza haematococci]|nr:hypothetical protein HK102_001229 [Quaeritorhiza haematococci]